MPRDRECLFDILEAARLAIQYLSGKTRDDFDRDTQCQDAVIRRLEIIGEAARRISEETKAIYPDLPWNEMIGMRNRLIHEYFRVNVSAVWDTIQDDIPILIRLVEPLVPKEDEI